MQTQAAPLRMRAKRTHRRRNAVLTARQTKAAHEVLQISSWASLDRLYINTEGMNGFSVPSVAAHVLYFVKVN